VSRRCEEVVWGLGRGDRQRLRLSFEACAALGPSPGG
jgi:hypothetical protein